MGTDADRGFRLWLVVYFGGFANAMSPKSKYSGVSYYDWFAELKNYPYLCGSAGIKFFFQICDLGICVEGKIFKQRMKQLNL